MNRISIESSIGFQLRLTGSAGNCIADGKVYRVDILASDVTAGGNIKNDALDNPAANVEVQLSDPFGPAIDLTGPYAIQFPPTVTGSESINLGAALVAPQWACFARNQQRCCPLQH